MRRMLLTAVLVVVVSSVAVAAASRNITSAQAKPLLDKGSVFLLDVRTPQEYQQARLNGAVLIPIDQVERRLGEIPKNKTILVYCAVGSRSNLVAGFLAEKGFREVYNMSDGIVGWYRNGLPIAR
ncbi:MAG: rhodanese-like domain-containing protein [Geobacteraceae bacterium]|nr:rhodanese-like domain-containing protein [Geobacteraceae bacterium]